MAFVKFVLNGRQNEIVASCCGPHGTKWRGFDSYAAESSQHHAGVVKFDVWQVRDGLF